MTKENATKINEGISNEDWEPIQRMLAKREEEKALEEFARKAARAKARRKAIKKRKQQRIASILNWVSITLAGSFIFQFIIKILDMKFPTDDSNFFGWLLIAWMFLVCIAGYVGEYIGTHIKDKD